MLDIQFIRNNLDLCKEAAQKKNRNVHWDKLLLLDDKRKELQGKADALRAQRNSLAKERTSDAAKAARVIKEGLKAVEEELRVVEGDLHLLLLTVPNIPDKSVPVGKGERENVEIKTWGDVPKFDFPVKNHIELAKQLDLVDFERGKSGGISGVFSQK